MMKRRGGPAAFAHLLPLLRDPAHCRTMTLAHWDETLRIGRRARLLGVLAHRLRRLQDAWEAIPPPAQGHLLAALHHSAHRAQMMRIVLQTIDVALPCSITLVLLKGAAYAAQALPAAQGRMPGDVDLLVRRSDLDAAEAALQKGGWVSTVRDRYDERYYREWSHELPPLRHPGHSLELDLHHAITPVTSRTRADDAALFADAQAVVGSRFFVLAPRDQIIHAAIHLFQDSELAGRLRDLVDIDALIRHHLTGEAAWAAFFARAEHHHASRQVWYALHYCRAWLDTPMPTYVALAAPPQLARCGMDWVFPRCCLPGVPDEAPTLATRVAVAAARVRYHRLRMPLRLLVHHLAYKAWQRLRRRREPPERAA